jgi:integrase/recombinase XerD
MTTIDTTTTTVEVSRDDFVIDDAQLAAVVFLARYSGRTLDAYRHDLRGFFQWAANTQLTVLAGTRPHVELFRTWMEARGLAASTIDRRLSTVCGFYRFAHIDGRIASNPAQYVRRPQVHPSNARGLDRSELGVFLFTAEQSDRAHAALAVLLGLNGLRVSEACATNIEDLGIERGHRTLRILGKGSKPATIPLVPRTARTIDLAVGVRSEGPILQRQDGERLDRRTAHRWVRSIGKRAGLGAVHPHMLRAAFIMAALEAGVPLRDVQLAARHADPRTTRSTTVAARTSIATPLTSSSPSWPEADPADQTGGGSIRSIVFTRSIGRSKEATWPIPVVSAHATRYASAKSIRSVSYTSTARRSSAGSTQTIESNATSERTASPTWSWGAA